ncbi:hypothetical protein Tco_1252818 [Tanacetum coccineum]
MIDDVPCGLIDMVIKDLDLEPNIDAMIRDFLEQVLEMDHFSLDDSSRDSSSISSTESSSDSSADALFDYASSHSSSDHSLPTPSSDMKPSHHLCSLVPSIHRSSAAISERPSHDSSSASPFLAKIHPLLHRTVIFNLPLEHLSYALLIILPSPKSSMSPETSYGFKVVVEAIDREEIEMGMRGPVEVRVDRVTHPVVADDIPEPAQEGAVEVIESVQRDHGHRIVATRQQSTDMSERIRELEWDNTRLKDMMGVASQRVARSQRRELRVQREMRTYFGV